MTTFASTLSLRYFPRVTTWMRDIFLIFTGALSVAILAQVKIFLPTTPIPCQR